MKCLGSCFTSTAKKTMPSESEEYGVLQWPSGEGKGRDMSSLCRARVWIDCTELLGEMKPSRYGQWKWFHVVENHAPIFPQRVMWCTPTQHSQKRTLEPESQQEKLSKEILNVSLFASSTLLSSDGAHARNTERSTMEKTPLLPGHTFPQGQERWGAKCQHCHSWPQTLPQRKRTCWFWKVCLSNKELPDWAVYLKAFWVGREGGQS